MKNRNSPAEPEASVQPPLTRRSILCVFGSLGLTGCGGGGEAGAALSEAQAAGPTVTALGFSGGNTAASAASQALSVPTPLGNKSIGMNFRHFRGYGMAAADQAGIARAGWWNNLTGPVQNGERLTRTALVDNLGLQVPGMSLTFTGNSGSVSLLGPDKVTVSPLTNDANLYASVYDQADGTASTLSITGIPYDSYDLYLYVYDDGATRAGAVTVNGQTRYIRGGAGNPAADGTGYVQPSATSTVPSDPALAGNYLLFEKLKGPVSASFVAVGAGSTPLRIKVCGVQIVRRGSVPAARSAPAAVAAGLSISAGNQEARMSWQAVPFATSYRIYRDGALIDTIDGSLTSYVDDQVSNGTSYAYAVSAMNAIGEGPRSAATAVMPAKPAYAPTRPLNAVYQYSIPVTSIFSTDSARPADPMRRAYLWVPPAATRLQGVVFGLHNMLEKPLFEDPSFRQACAEAGLAIVFVSPGDAKVWTPKSVGNYNAGLATTAMTLDPNEYTPAEINPATGVAFANSSEQAGAEVAVLLQRLAAESRYPELAFAPILLAGHSAASTFVWTRSVHTSQALKDRVFAILAYKGTFPGGVPTGVPVLHVSSEWQEISNWGNTWEVGDAPSMRNLRLGGAERLLGEYVQPGTGHYQHSETQVEPIGQFIKAAASLRIPQNWSPAGYPTLKTVTAASGWLIDVRTLGSGAATALAYADWVAAGRNPLNAYWYPDQATATTACAAMNTGFNKKPQLVNAFKRESTVPYPLDNPPNSGAGWVGWGGSLAADGVTIQVRARGMNKSPVARLYHGGPVGVAPGPVLFKANGSGALRQTGPDTFRVWMDRGSVIKTGQPWEPFLIAWHPGDDAHREADRPIKIESAIVNQTTFSGGATQTLTFDDIPHQSADALGNIGLRASSSAGSAYPAQFWVASGPYYCDNVNNATLVPAELAAGARFPLRVVVGAWQWGKPKVYQSAAPVFKTFWLFQTAAQKASFIANGSQLDSAGFPIIP